MSNYCPRIHHGLMLSDISQQSLSYSVCCWANQLIQTPDQVDQTTEIEQTGNDANKILLVNIIKNLINLTISALSTVGNDYSQEQKETEKLSAQNKISKLNQVINTINTPDMKLNDIIAMVDNSIKLD